MVSKDMVNNISIGSDKIMFKIDQEKDGAKWVV
jgi:hypothetical protein